MAGGGPFGAAASSPARSLHHLPHLPCALRAAHFPSKALLPPGYAQVGRRDCLRMRIASWPSLVNPKSQSLLIHRHLFVNHARGGYGHENMRGTGAPCQCIVQNSTFVACAAKIYTGSGFTSTNGQVLFDRTRMLAPQFVPFAKSGSSDSLPAVAADDIVEDDDHPHAWNLPLSHTLPLIQPFLLSQWQLIMRAWACTVVSVVALFLFIPQTGQLSDLVGKGDLPNLARKCMLMAALLATRSMAQFYQQSLLWEVALRVTYEIRCHVFKRLLRNDLEYFESRDGVPAGDIVFRITSEAEDTGDSVYSFLETLIPSTLQLVAMSIRMILLSPLLSVVTILVRVVKM